MSMDINAFQPQQSQLFVQSSGVARKAVCANYPVAGDYYGYRVVTDCTPYRLRAYAPARARHAQVRAR